MRFQVANVITGSGSQDARSQDEGASLTSVLHTPMLRVELALLVLLATDAMRSELLATFDPSKTHNSENAIPSPKATTPSHQDLISFDAPHDEATLTAEREKHARQAEIQSTEIQALRRAALTFFDKWRSGVMQRICDVLCVRGEVVRNAKAKHKAAKDASERAKSGSSLLIDLDGSDPFSDAPPSKLNTHAGHYVPIDNNLTPFVEPKRVLIVHCVLLLLLSLEHYPAHSRVLLLHLASSLHVDVNILAEHERSVAQGLLASAASHMDAEEAAKKKAAEDSSARKWKIGLAAVGGAVLIGVTGGLAAPLLAAGVGTVMGGLGLGATVISGYLGALAGSSVLVGGLFGAYGGKMTGKMMKQYAKEVDDFEFIPIQDPARSSGQSPDVWGQREEDDARDPSKREQHRLRVSIGISGWLNSPADVSKPWEVIEASGIEPFALRFEMEAMLRLGNTLQDVLFSYVWDGVTYAAIKHTLLGALYAGLWPLGLIKAASVLQNPFSVAVARADKAGKVLAHALISKVQGERPVTLIGYSLGARVIYSCLVELADQNAFGLVESVVLMGAPVPSDSRPWRKIRTVVTARMVNVYSSEDYILGFLYRAAKAQNGVAGLQEVKDVYGIENLDVSDQVTAHDRYRYLVGSILARAGLEDVNHAKVAEQVRALQALEKKKEMVKTKAKQKAERETRSQPSSTVFFDREDEERSAQPAPLPPRPAAPENIPRQPTVQRSGHQPFRAIHPQPQPFQSGPMDSLSGSIPVELKAMFPEMKSDMRRSPGSRGEEAPPPYSIPATQSSTTVFESSGPIRAATVPNPPMDSSDEENGVISMRDAGLAGQQEIAPALPFRGSPVVATETVVAKDVDRAKKSVMVEVSAVETSEEWEEEDEDEDENENEGSSELAMVEPSPLED